MASNEKKLTISYIESEGIFKDDRIRTIPDGLRHYAELFGDKEAIVFADYEGGREVVTWKEAYEKSLSTARGLKKLGVQEDEFVTINVRPCPEWLYLCFGSIMMGATPVCASFTYKDGSDLIALMKKLERCSALAMDPGFNGENWDVVKRLIDSSQPGGEVQSSKMPYLRYLIGLRDDGVMGDAKQSCDLITDDSTSIELPEIDEEHMAFLVQTSGSTGVPKLVVHTHKFSVLLKQISGSVDFLDESFIQYNDRPFTWIGGFPFNLIVGQKRVTVSGFCSPPADKIGAVIEIIQRERCTFVTALPPMLNAITEKMTTMPENWPVEILLTGGQPLTNSLAKAIGRATPTLLVGYGCTEFLFLCSGAVTEKDKFQQFWCGKLSQTPGIKMKIVDDKGQIVPVNTRGEIYMKTPTMFKEYFNDPIKTANVFTADGWFKTDDIAMLTENGDIFVYGRKSNMIISGGMNVEPEILERVIASCPDIASVIIVPVPDDIMYQVLCACVVRKPGSDLDEKQIRTFCKDIHNDTPALFTVLPKYYLFFDNFPETYTGKISRQELAKIAAEKFCK